MDLRESEHVLSADVVRNRWSDDYRQIRNPHVRSLVKQWYFDLSGMFLPMSIDHISGSGHIARILGLSPRQLARLVRRIEEKHAVKTVPVVSIIDGIVLDESGYDQDGIVAIGTMGFFWKRNTRSVGRGNIPLSEIRHNALGSLGNFRAASMILTLLESDLQKPTQSPGRIRTHRL